MIELEGYVKTEDLSKSRFTFVTKESMEMPYMLDYTEVKMSYDEIDTEVTLTVDEIRKLIGKFYPHPNSPKVQKALNKLVCEKRV